MSAPRAIACAFAGWLYAVGGSAASGDAPPSVPASAAAQAPAIDQETKAALDAIRSKIVALDFEGAVTATDTFLSRPGLSDDARVEALDLRSQAHVAADDIDAAERDYRAILALQPGYAPNRDLTSKRALDRFAKVSAALLGRIRIILDPPDATVTIDGRRAEADASGVVRALAGERKVHVERKGYDAIEQTIRAAANEETPLKVSLVPNARAIIVHTDLPGVSVMIDGVPSGDTAAVASTSGGEGGAELRIDDVPIGEHTLLLEKSCFAPETISEMVRVDLADRTPERLRPVTMRPARARIAVTGTAYTGELRVDGTLVGSLPLDSFTMCPGRRNLEAVAGGRVVWAGTVEAGEADMTLDLSPRPSCTLVGQEWPATWGAAASSWSLRGRLDPPAGSRLGEPSGWTGVALPAGTDIALAIIPHGGAAGEERIVLYSPALEIVEDRPVAPDVSRPSWSVASLGVAFADAPAGVVVASVATNGPGAKGGVVPGDRVTGIGNRPISRAADAVAEVERGAAGSKVTLSIASPGAPARSVSIDRISRPLVDPALANDASRAIRAAWAAADAAAGGPDAAAALAQLAVLLDRAGRVAPATEAWRKVRALAGPDEGLAARADYAVAAALASGSGQEQAAELLTRAKREAESAGDAALAAAASDRLADLGIGPR